MCIFCGLSESDYGVGSTHYVYANNRANLFNGYSLAEFVFGDEGNDTIYGNQGNDTLYGNEGNDLLQGGVGSDKLVGDTFADSINYSSNDTLRGGAGNDELFGGFGNDQLFGDADNDLIYGEDGNDRVIGGSGNDTLYGGNGIDSSNDRDTLSGNAGEDLLIGGADNDLLIGGSGNDRFGFFGTTNFTSAMLGIDTIKDFVKAVDKIVLDKTVFTTLTSQVGSSIDLSEFIEVANDAAAMTRQESIVYSRSTGNLLYNENGEASGFGEGGQFAILQEKPELIPDDIIIVES
jgi:Ca2+-binding RTX toxin-like protein